MKSRNGQFLGRHAAAIVLVVVGVSSCGGSDDSPVSTDPDVPIEQDIATNEPTSEPMVSDPLQGAPIQVDEDGDIAFSDEAGAAIDSVGFEGMMSIVAGQLDPEPTVKVDGPTATFTFEEGSVDSSWLPCSVAGSFVEDGQTVTVIYPDGSVDC